MTNGSIREIRFVRRCSPYVVSRHVKQRAAVQVLQRAPAVQNHINSCLMYLKCNWNADLRGLANFVQIDDDLPCSGNLKRYQQRKTRTALITKTRACLDL